MDALYRIVQVGHLPLTAGMLVTIHKGRAFPAGCLLAHRDRRGRTWLKPHPQPRGVTTYVGERFAQVCVRTGDAPMLLNIGGA